MIETSTAPKGEIRSDLGIDFGTFRCGRSRLTRREHQLLGVLNRHFGLVVVWERLVATLYADDERGGPENPRSVLSVIVCGLRRKMLHTGYQIVTIPNEGLLLKYRDYIEGELCANRFTSSTAAAEMPGGLPAQYA